MAVRKVFLSLTEYPYVKEISVTFPWLNGAKQQNVQAVLDAFHDVYPGRPGAGSQSGILAAGGRRRGGNETALLPENAAGCAGGHGLRSVQGIRGRRPPTRNCCSCPARSGAKTARSPKTANASATGWKRPITPVQPYPYAFFNWLYGCTLRRNPEQAGRVLKFGAFSDLDLGSSKKDRNSPARAAAVYAGLAAAGKLDCYESFEAFVRQTCVEPLPEPQETPEPAEPVSVPEPEAETPQAAEKVPEKTPENNHCRICPRRKYRRFFRSRNRSRRAHRNRQKASRRQSRNRSPWWTAWSSRPSGRCRRSAMQPKVKNLLISLAKNRRLLGKNGGRRCPDRQGTAAGKLPQSTGRRDYHSQPGKEQGDFPAGKPGNGFPYRGSADPLPGVRARMEAQLPVTGNLQRKKNRPSPRRPRNICSAMATPSHSRCGKTNCPRQRCRSWHGKPAKPCGIPRLRHSCSSSGPICSSTIPLPSGCRRMPRRSPGS